jgi:hypothetical protein
MTLEKNAPQCVTMSPELPLVEVYGEHQISPFDEDIDDEGVAGLAKTETDLSFESFESTSVSKGHSDEAQLFTEINSIQADPAPADLMSLSQPSAGNFVPAAGIERVEDNANGISENSDRPTSAEEAISSVVEEHFTGTSPFSGNSADIEVFPSILGVSDVFDNVKVSLPVKEISRPNTPGGSTGDIQPPPLPVRPDANLIGVDIQVIKNDGEEMIDSVIEAGA